MKVVTKSIREQRRKEAEVRNENYNSLTLEEKINHINKVNGMNVGAKKQRAKLAVLLSKPHRKSEAAVPVVEEQTEIVKPKFKKGVSTKKVKS